MLYKLEVENFFAIRDLQILDLIVDGKVVDEDGRLTPVYPGASARVPKVVAVYGANASGKTTVLRALEFILSFIRDSVQRTVPGFAGIERFNDATSRDRPIRFAIEMGGAADISPDVLQRLTAGEEVEQGLYRYELAIEVVEGVATRVAHEALRQRPNGVGKWQRLFERDANGQIKDSRVFNISGYRHLVKTLAANHSVLSSFAKFQHPTAQLLVEQARRAVFQVEPVQASVDSHIVNYLKQSPAIVARLNDELRRIDVGVESVAFRESADGAYLMFKHTGLDVEMPWLLESHGTRAFIKMFPYISAGLDMGAVIAIDEMDSAIHPVVLPELLRWLYDPVRNPHSAQLWLSCHSASLLDDLTKEEIVLCEKDRQGRTRVYSLMDVQTGSKARRDDNHYRKYLSGAYGGVPHLG